LAIATCAGLVVAARASGRSGLEIAPLFARAARLAARGRSRDSASRRVPPCGITLAAPRSCRRDFALSPIGPRPVGPVRDDEPGASDRAGLKTRAYVVPGRSGPRAIAGA
jgi:hypothetical protein